jgi:hypothetical protein
MSAVNVSEPAPIDPPAAARSQIAWHRLLGAVLEALLTPVGISVQTEVPITSDPPRADILLLRRAGPTWTAEQRDRLPDGVRASSASHILLEFKYSESVNGAALLQALAYDYFYRQTQRLKATVVQTFVVSAKTPRQRVLHQFNYSPTETPGLYRSSDALLQRVPLLVLNGLSDEPHNAFVKCFASQREEKSAAFGVLEQVEVRRTSGELEELLEGLWTLWFGPKGLEMQEIEITPEMVRSVGKRWRQFTLAGLTPEERLAGLAPEERLAGLAPEERLAGLAPEERLAGLDPAVVEAWLRQQKQAAAGQAKEKAKAPPAKPRTRRKRSSGA